MTIPTTPGRIARASLLAALLATAAVALSGAFATAGAQAAEPPQPRTFRVTADLDGHLTPNMSNVAAVDFLLKNQQVQIECQRYGQRAYGSRLWDLVKRGANTLFVTDRFIKTGTNGRAPGVRRCDLQDGPDRD
jgi:hypothetical protein